MAGSLLNTSICYTPCGGSHLAVQSMCGQVEVSIPLCRIDLQHLILAAFNMRMKTRHDSGSIRLLIYWTVLSLGCSSCEHLSGILWPYGASRLSLVVVPDLTCMRTAVPQAQVREVLSTIPINSFHKQYPRSLCNNTGSIWEPPSRNLSSSKVSFDYPRSMPLPPTIHTGKVYVQPCL